MNQYLSKKLKVISFILMVMVVYLHSYNFFTHLKGDETGIPKGYNFFIQEFVSHGIARIAVPLFFLISGYLFYLNINKGQLNEFEVKYKRRLRTLVVPYLLWSVYGLLLFIVLQSIPQPRAFFNNELIRDYSLPRILSVIFLHPIAYQLWFLRDLIVLVLFSPVIYWVLRYLWPVALTLFLIAWFINYDLVLFSSESLLFFTTGALISIKKVDPQIKFKNGYLAFSVVWLVFLLIKTVLIYNGHSEGWLMILLHKSSILAGILGIWFLYDYVKGDQNSHAGAGFGLPTFFLYGFHEPALTLFKKGLYFVLGKTELDVFVIYLIAPVIVVFTAYILAIYLKRLTPGFYSLITGNR